GRWLWLAGAIAIVLPQLVQHPVFDSRWTNWTGLVTRKPITEDYVPLLPGLGVMWWGPAAGTGGLARRPQWFSGAIPRAGAPLATLG
ncbi:heparan-alpha-glucosaminide N-acetyltransferase domain-containing protein, partial [Acinetobacter baumannii]